MQDTLDRRAVERYPVNGDTFCPLVAPVAEHFGPAKIKDLSMAGVGLLTSRRVEPGALLAVTLSNPLRGILKTVLVRVTHSTPGPGGYHVGGTFTAPLTYQEMTALVM